MENIQVSETGLAIVEKHDALAINRAPDVVLEEARKAAVALKDVIENKANKVQFNGKTYLQFEDWQTLGRFYGVTAMCRETKYVEFGEGDEKVTGFEARAEALLVGTNQVISSAEAMCLKDEPNWSRKPMFQLKSMAQTRACAKALRNVLAWVVVLAGYAPTPAEEMEDTNGQYVQPPRRKSAPQVLESTQKAEPMPSPEELHGMFEEELASPPDVFKPEPPKPVGMTVCPKCGGRNIKGAGISKQGKPYQAFCRDCADKR